MNGYWVSATITDTFAVDGQTKSYRRTITVGVVAKTLQEAIHAVEETYGDRDLEIHSVNKRGEIEIIVGDVA